MIIDIILIEGFHGLSSNMQTDLMYRIIAIEWQKSGTVITAALVMATICGCGPETRKNTNKIGKSDFYLNMHWQVKSKYWILQNKQTLLPFSVLFFQTLYVFFPGDLRFLFKMANIMTCKKLFIRKSCDVHSEILWCMFKIWRCILKLLSCKHVKYLVMYIQ